MEYMARQNRVTPAGEIIATPARGTLMGNRGCLHNEQGQIVRPYQGKRWIICRLEFKGRQRSLMSPGRYTELFFLDEATALAAGHRPCKECSAARFKEFVAAWAQANPGLADRPDVQATRLDTILHQERLDGRRKKSYLEKLANLPQGCFVVLEDGGPPYLVFQGKLLAWRPEGYGQVMAAPGEQVVRVLTPRSVVRTLAYGYQAGIHPSGLAANG